MPGPTQTPASKRFLASQNTSSSTSTKRSQFLRTPKQNTSTSSPYTSTPSFRKQSTSKDEIETSFDDEDIDGDLTASTAKPSPNIDLHTESIEDESQEHYAHQITDADSAGWETVFQSPQGGNGNMPFDTELSSSPLPKRRKRRNDHTDEYISMPVSHMSASAVVSGRSPRIEQRPAGQDQVDKHVDFVEQPTPLSSRFLLPNLTKGSNTGGQAKPSFKAFLQHAVAEDSSRPALALPDAFSPSRRKGKREYISGGSADTVRNWILQLASEQSRQESQQDMVKSVKHVMSDESGRFEIVEDGERKPWMLVRQADRSPNSSLQDVADIAGTVRISLKGSAANWTVASPGQIPLTVAVLWDIVRPSL